MILTIALWRWFRKREKPSFFSILSILLCISVSVALTQHALAAARVLFASSPLRTFPDLTLFYLAVHYALVVWLTLGDLVLPSFHILGVWLTLFLYSSYLYFRTFFAVEQGTAYPILYALILGQVLLRTANLHISELASRRLSIAIRHSLLVPLSAFLSSLGIATVLSAATGESLGHYLRIVCFALVPFLLAHDLTNARAWHVVAAWIVVLGGSVFVGLAGVKFGVLARDLGLISALRHRLFIADIGPNWVSRSLVTLLPLSIGFLLTVPNRQHKFLWGTGILGMLLTVAYAQSNLGYSGWIALALGAGTLVLLLKWAAIERWWKSRPQARRLIAVASIASMAVMVLCGGWLAVQVNAYSFNGRLYVWHIALQQTVAHPIFGGGLGVRHIASQYGARVLWENMGPRSQWFIDNPLSQTWQKRQTVIHTHNLLLELSTGAGLPSLLAFLWFLWELARRSLATLRQATGQPRVLLAGCIAGIVASLGWGLIDVMEYSPPFFTTPTWVLVGLLLAAPKAFNIAFPDPAELRWASWLGQLPIGRWATALRSLVADPRSGVLRALFWGLCSAIVLVVIVMPLAGNRHYRLAYIAYQEHRWADAEQELACAARWEPLNAKYQQLRGESLINLGQYEQAIAAYERALRLRRDFAPYHSQLGWLHWLQGDLDQAIVHFEKAIEMDPREAWRDGLHADLGLAYTAQGRTEEAVPFLKKTIELEPEMALMPYWVPVQGADGQFDVVLDPAYANGQTTVPAASRSGMDKWASEQMSKSEDGPISDSLERRILAHLGRADYTPRLFDYETDTESPLSLNRVLDAIEVDYVAARATGSREAPRLLATVAETARLAGLYERAEYAYLAFQETYPESAYGFRDLGVLYQEQERLEAAQATLERAIWVSPHDTDSWLGLADVYLNQAMWEEAEEALGRVYKLAPLNAQLYALRARLYREQGDLAQAADNLHKSVFIQESVPDRLALAELYRQLEQPRQARKQCLQAADVLRRAWARSLDPELWEVGVCLAKTSGYSVPVEITKLAQERPLMGNVLLGHFYRVRGPLERALLYYKDAAEARPDEAAPIYLMGEMYRSLGQARFAEEEYRQAAQLASLESLPLVALGQLQWEQGQTGSALETLRAAVEVTPGWGEAQMALGNVLLATGDRAGAARHYRLAQVADRALREDVAYDFIVHLAEAKIESPEQRYVRNDVFTIDGERQRVLFEHPDSRISYTVDVPSDAWLAFDVAMQPESWEQPGDGVHFVVYVEAAQGTGHATHNTQQLFSTYIDPKHNEADRRWHPFVVDLSPWAGEVVTLIFETRAGPDGDYRYDWAGWGEPRLLTPW